MANEAELKKMLIISTVLQSVFVCLSTFLIKQIILYRSAFCSANYSFMANKIATFTCYNDPMNKRIPIIIGFIILIIAIWAQITPAVTVRHFIERLEHLAYDVQLRTRLLVKQPPLQTSVAIIDIDDKSLSKEGRWPWPRSKLAELISKAAEEGAVVIAMDMIFPEKENNIVDIVSQELSKQKLMTPAITPILSKIQPIFDNDSIFADSLKKIDVVIGITFSSKPIKEGALLPPLLALTAEQKNLDLIQEQGYISNIATLQSTTKSNGFINVFPDDDGIIRRVPLLIRYQDTVYPSLALEAVRLFLLSDVRLITAPYGDTIKLETVQVGSHKIPVDAQAQVVVPFRGESFTFPFYSATDLLHKRIPADALSGKIVFIGTSATGLGDLPSTAIQSTFPGVEVQATIADGILTDNFSYKPAWSTGAEVFTTVALGILLIFVFPFLGPRLLSILILGIPIILIFSNNFLWEKTGLLISIFIPMTLTIFLGILNIAYGYLFETRRRERLKEIFGQYVPEKHIDEMLQTSGDYGMHGEEREMTVLFADIRHFTTISEHLPASQLKELLNQFFTPMTEIIFKYRGTIDKYVGDLIMAFWGAPLKDKKHAQHSIAAALDMQQMVKKLHPLLAQHGWPKIDIGIGLNSGMMSVGDMGSKFRRNYTVLGDAVNLASRAEGLTKFYGVSIIVTENTFKQQKLFVFRQLDKVRVKGKQTGIGIYEVICRKNEATPEILEEIAQSQTALELYFLREWDMAIALFSQLKTKSPDTKLYSIYLQRIADLQQTPPPADWDGIYSHTSK